MKEKVQPKMTSINPSFFIIIFEGKPVLNRTV